jgi:exodeoxyribonuclease V alpha subunit
MSEELRGEIKKILFRNDISGYSVAIIQPDEGKKITATGSFIAISEGDRLKLTGQRVLHPKYGEQFAVASYEQIMPEAHEDIEKFLVDCNIKGLGPAMAKKIVTKFGDDTFWILDNDIARLCVVKGLSQKTLSALTEYWEKTKSQHETLFFLQSHGISPAESVKISKVLGPEAKGIISRNPYVLIGDLFGIGFLKADRIAFNIGITEDSPERMQAAVLFTLKKLAEEGHVCYPYSEFILKCANDFHCNTELITEAVASLDSLEKIVLDKEHIYLSGLFEAECYAAAKIYRMSHTASQSPNYNGGQFFSRLEQEMGLQLASEQKEAISASVKSRIVVITGGPGTGKTTIVKGIISLYEKHKKNVLLAAPTGRAAKKLSEASGLKAKTIHRLLEFNPYENSFQRNESYPLEADVIIIDETSMVDILLLYYLMGAIPDTASVIFVGDVDQLPSIGPGSVLNDMINSETVPTFRLSKIFRQSSGSSIIINAHRVNHGQMPETGDMNEDDFIFEEIAAPIKTVERIRELYTKILPGKFFLDPYTDIQLITPMHRGTLGDENLNNELQQALNPDGQVITKGFSNFKVNDKVMQIKNNYEKDVFNGDIGKITGFNKAKKEITILFEGRSIKYSIEEMEEIKLAYACTVHKAQGSEYPAVIMPMTIEHMPLLQRNLLYTAITRGSKSVVMLGSKQAVERAVNNNRAQKRFTFFCDRLKEDI